MVTSNEEITMKTFTVYQLQGPNYRDARFNLGFGDNPVALAEKLFNQRSYQLVADIKAVDLNHVFQIGNIGPEENITRIGQMCSLSVGDVIQCQETGDCFLIANFGFQKLFEKEAA